MEYDLIIIGGGAADLMAAGTAASAGAKVVLLEKMEKPARKVRITGKGRCNLTNIRPAEEFLAKIQANREFFAPAYAEFDNRALVKFFERLGVRLSTEQGGRVFPKSGKAWDIAEALVEWCREAGVEILPVVLDGTKTLIRKNAMFNWGNRITIRVLPPVPAAKVVSTETHVLMEEVHDAMSAALAQIRNRK
mgnify:CR=1 FL=1